MRHTATLQDLMDSALHHFKVRGPCYIELGLDREGLPGWHPEQIKLSRLLVREPRRYSADIKAMIEAEGLRDYEWFDDPSLARERVRAWTMPLRRVAEEIGAPVLRRPSCLFYLRTVVHSFMVSWVNRWVVTSLTPEIAVGFYISECDEYDYDWWSRPIALLDRRREEEAVAGFLREFPLMMSSLPSEMDCSHHPSDLFRMLLRAHGGVGPKVWDRPLDDLAGLQVEEGDWRYLDLVMLP